MTWRELQQRIAEMPSEWLDSDVKVWGEDVALTKVRLAKAAEDMYYNPDWCEEGCDIESNIPPEEIGDCKKVCSKGYPYLWTMDER